MSRYPQIFRLRQHFQCPRVVDVAADVHAELAKLQLGQRIGEGQSVAITAGSRGIANIPVVIRAIAEHVRSLDAEPFVVPAMGSHGGGTAAGQQEILEGYGITETFIGCPIRSSMETVAVCRTAEGIPVRFDRLAYEADHVVVCGRVKPHTDFVGDIESGLMKMMLIGLGKHDGAKIYHRAIQDYSFGQIVRSVAQHVLEKCSIVAGLALVENSYDETAHVAAVAPRDFESREGELLRMAKRYMPRLPFDRADILLVDEMGKNISGAGMDTNVVGRKFQFHKAADDEVPKIKHIAVRGLTDETHGNAAGIGMAEFIHSRILQQIDMQATRINCLTAGRPAGSMLPVDLSTDREILDVTLPIIGLREPEDARLMWIVNTLDLAEVECSAAYLEEATAREDLEVISEPRDLPFDDQHNLPAVKSAVAVG